MKLNSLADILFANQKIDNRQVALVHGERRISFGELRQRVADVANALVRDGIKKGERVAILLPNRPEFIELFFGITAVGAITVPLNTRLHPEEHVQLLLDCQPTILVASDEYRPSINAIATAVPSTRKFVVLGADQRPDESDYGTWAERGCGQLPEVELNAKDPATIPYTSGTTSSPKGVVLTHRNYLADLAQVTVEVRPHARSVNLQLSPLYHAAAVHTLVHLASGATSLLNSRFDPESVLSQIQSERVTYFFAVPTMLYQILDHPRLEEYDLTSLELVSYGAAAIFGVRLEQAIRVFGLKLIHAYGMTETCSHASVLRPDEHLIAPGSVGRGIAGIPIRVVDKSGNVVGPGDVGEIVFRGDNVMQGYWGQPDETAQAIRDGWLHSGDLARVDDEGYVYIVDRRKDIVISGGVNIYPREAEEVLATHPDVAEVAVYGIPDPLWGEALAAAIVLRPGHRTTARELIEFARNRLAGFKLPKRVEILTDLPKTASGKVRKTELRDRHSIDPVSPNN